MRSERRSVSVRLTLVPGGDGQGGSGSVSTTYGCERVDGITSRRIQLAQLSGWLNDLERQVEMLESRFLEVLDTLSIDILRPAGRLLTIMNTEIIREEEGDVRTVATLRD